MKKTASILFILLIVNNVFCANENGSATSSLLWKISGNGLSSPSYIYGTIHIIPKDDFFLPESVENAFESVETLVMEINLDIPVKDQLAMAQRIMLPDNKTIANYLNDSIYNLFKAYLIDSLEISEGKLNRYVHIKPAHMMGILLMEKYKHIETYEVHFNKMAKKADLDFLALETIDFQLDLLDSIPLEEQFKDFDAQLVFTEYEKLLNCYKQSNLDCMLELMKMYENATMLNALIFERNTNWAEKLDQDILSNQSVFIAVGAGHLPGDKGLINLLRDKGYTVEPIK